MRTSHPAGVAAVLAAVFAVASAAQEHIEVILDGDRSDRRSGRPWAEIRDFGEARAPGDLLGVGGVLLRLPEVQSLRLREAMDAEGRIQREHEGRWITVAVDTKRLLALSAAERSELLGVRVDRWSPAIAEALSKLPAELPITLTTGAASGEERRLPPIPPHFQHLRLVLGDEQPFGELGGAAAWSALRSLEILGNFEEAAVDLRCFSAATRLQCLSVSYVELRGLEVLSAWRELRSFRGLGLRWSGLEGLGRARALRRIVLEELEHVDLAALATLPELRCVQLSGCSVARIPRDGFPRLERLELDECSVAASEIDLFRERFPRCAMPLVADDGALQAVLARADRVEVHTVRHPDGEGEERKLLYVSEDRAELARIAALLRVENSAQHRHYQCDADPCLRFYARGELIAELCSIYGMGLRVMEGPWLTDAHMREEQALPLARWFARIGTHLPLWSLQHDLAEAASMERRWQRRAEIAGVFLEGVSHDGAAILERVDVDPAGALLALRLLGCWESDWCELDEFDGGSSASARESPMSAILDRVGVRRSRRSNGRARSSRLPLARVG